MWLNKINRFNGLGGRSLKKFEDLIGKVIRLDAVILQGKINIEEILNYYMGKNTPERQEFIIENLTMELDELVPGEERRNKNSQR